MADQDELPMNERQYVAVKFKPWDRKSYTFHNDGEPVAIGDFVIVELGFRPQTVEVTALPHVKPEGFDTKPIRGKAPKP